jgi:cation diffusion facilitator CzcD-associated flavoprotein CzcO
LTNCGIWYDDIPGIYPVVSSFIDDLNTVRDPFPLMTNNVSQGGFRFLMNNYFDMTREVNPNREAYNYWRDKVRARIYDPKKAELLAPMEPPHPFGAKRLSLEQDFYDQFNRPNINVVDMKTTPIKRIEPEGILTADGTFHKLDVIALATGFDSITGGLKDIAIRGLDGELLADKWNMGTWTYLGMTTARFPNFFLYVIHILIVLPRTEQ